MKRHHKRVAVFQPEFLQDLRLWVKTEHSVAVRVLDLVEAAMRNPLSPRNTGWSIPSRMKPSIFYRPDTTIKPLDARYTLGRLLPIRRPASVSFLIARHCIEPYRKPAVPGFGRMTAHSDGTRGFTGGDRALALFV